LGLDYKKEGMLIAMIVHPPAFGLKLKSFDGAAAKTMPGIKDVFKIDVYKEGDEAQWCDTISFNDLVVVVGNTTWEVMNAKKAITCEWEQINSKGKRIAVFWKNQDRWSTPSGLENTERSPGTE
jgi:isoquinoline 1-oxidoreductase beta subunit